MVNHNNKKIIIIIIINNNQLKKVNQLNSIIKCNYQYLKIKIPQQKYHNQ